MPKTKIRFEDLEQGLTSQIAITSNSVNAVSVDGNTFSVDALNNRIGIGTTAPAHALDVRNGNIYAHNGSFLLSGFNAIGGSQYFGKEYLGGIIAGMEIENTTLGGNYSQKLHFRVHNFGVSEGRAMTIGESGNVGIGTATPTSKLEVAGNGLFAGGTEIGIVTNGFYGDGGNIAMRTFPGGGHYFQSSGGAATHMYINPAGNVGIGTVSPTSKLQVVGLPSYADNAAAITGGLTVGAFYHTAGVLKVVI